MGFVTHYHDQRLVSGCLLRDDATLGSGGQQPIANGRQDFERPPDRVRTRW